MASKYQYTTSPRKLEPEIKPNKKQKDKNQKLKVVKDIPRQEKKISIEEKKKQRKITILIVMIFAVLLTISYRNSQINESFSQVQTLKKELSSLQKENEQLKVNIENSLNFNYIEQMAKEKLGMQKLTNKQTVYVSLPKKDYTESASEKIIVQDKNWFEQIYNKIVNIK